MKIKREVYEYFCKRESELNRLRDTSAKWVFGYWLTIGSCFVMAFEIENRVFGLTCIACVISAAIYVHKLETSMNSYKLLYGELFDNVFNEIERILEEQDADVSDDDNLSSI